MSKHFDFDLFVIGAGSGGVRAARMAAAYGARVGIAEENHLGGTCVNVGCIPKKLFYYGARVFEEFDDSYFYGWIIEKAHFKWERLQHNKDKQISKLNETYETLLTNAGVEIFSSRAKFIDHHTIEVDNTSISSEKVLIATGSAPFIPSFPGSKYGVTSDDMFQLQELPDRIVIVGGGYIAVEFAGIMHALGVDTTLVYRDSQLLKRFDQDIRRVVGAKLSEDAIDLHFNTDIVGIQKNRAGLTLETNRRTSIDTDLVLFATGRTPLTRNIGRENTQIKNSVTGAIVVNDEYQTSVPNIFALGDVIDRAQLTPVAIAEGMAFAKRQFNDESTFLDYSLIPTCVFCMPNVATVGPTEEEARAKYTEIEIFESTFQPLKHTMTGLPEEVYMKLIVDRQTDKLLSAHMVGPEAGEIIQGFAVAITAGATKSQLDRTIAIHPTTAEEFVTMRTSSRN